MMNKIFYSAKNKGFYPAASKDYYESLNVWPDDVIEVSDDDYKYLFEGQAAGKVITAADDGKPILTDPPSPTREELIYMAGIKKNRLMAEATSVIAPLQDAIDISEATDAERTKVTSWKKYRVLLNRIDINDAPDIDWPEPA